MAKTGPDPLRPKRSGTVFRYVEAKPGERQGHYVVRCSAPDGSRPVFHLDPSPKSPAAKKKAQRTAEHITETLWTEGLGAVPHRGGKRPAALPSSHEETETWWDRFFEHREAKGMTSVRGIYVTHIRPVVSAPWSEVTQADCERLRDALDQRVKANEIASKTAFNAWTVFRTACKAASGRWGKKDKQKSLKVREGDPSDGVAGPDYDAADAKQLQWLYPREVLAVAGCARVPLQARRRIVLATYLCVRGGELKALTWDKIDLDRGVVRIDRSYDRATGVLKKTKTGNRGSRRYSFESTLVPLLRAMYAQRTGDHVIDVPEQKYWAKELRDALRTAGVRRPELFSTTDTSKRLRFHDLKASGLTWMGIRGDPPVQIQHVAGHTTFSMTKKYLDTGGAVDLLPGEVPFPPLPESLLQPDNAPPGVLSGGALLSQELSQMTQALETIVDTTATNSNRGGARG